MALGIPLGLFVLLLAWSCELAFGDDLWLWVTAWVFISIGLLSAISRWRSERSAKRTVRIRLDPEVRSQDDPYMS